LWYYILYRKGTSSGEGSEVFILENLKRFAQTDALAAVGEEGEMSYRLLEDRSEALAAYLVETYPGKAPIVLQGDKEHDMLTGIMAALKSGRPYVAVADNCPEARSRQILEACRPCAVLNIGKGGIKSDLFPAMDREEIEKVVRDRSGKTVDPSNWVQPQDIVCIYFTSGSMGAPKAVLVSRRNVEIHANARGTVAAGDNKVRNILNIPSYTFVASSVNIFVRLGFFGSTLKAVDRGLAADYGRLSEFMFKEQPEDFMCTPSFAEILLKDPRFNSRDLPNVKVIGVGGEVVPNRIISDILDRFPQVQVVNGYGSTETLSANIRCVVTREMALSDKPIPLGRAAPYAQVYVTDDDGNVLPEGETGELVVVSGTVCEGYLNDPERNKSSFFVAENGMRGFRTRDLARIEDGLVYYVGRKDNLEKVGGYRVEIEEVERCLKKVDIVSECAVVPAQSGGHTVMLVAYVVLRQGSPSGLSTVIKIKKDMAQTVPGYMIPQKIVFLDSMPLNASNKIDRALLKERSAITEK
jgi:D-alanine--poly(phosphoribitol) ligase subunit 1